MTNVPQWGIILYVRQRYEPLKKGSEEMEDMTVKQIARLIEWLKANGFTDQQIIDCIEYLGK